MDKAEADSRVSMLWEIFVNGKGDDVHHNRMDWPKDAGEYLWACVEERGRETFGSARWLHMRNKRLSRAVVIAGSKIIVSWLLHVAT